VPERLRVRRRLDTHNAIAPTTVDEPGAKPNGSSRLRIPLPPSEK